MMVLLYRNSLVRINEMINPFTNRWKNVRGTNCYAYALGMDLTREDIYPFDRFNPGTFSFQFLDNPFGIDELLECIDGDLDCLGLEHKEVDYNYQLKNKEWKIAVMATSSFNLSEACDFHFLREVRNGIWTHKRGFEEEPCNLDHYRKRIINPVDSVIETEGLFCSIKYDYIKTICLKKK